MWRKKNAYREWRGRPKGKTIKRLRHSWEMIIKMDLIETGWEDMLWTKLAPNMDKWQAVLHTAMKYPVRYRLAEGLLASLELLCSVQLATCIARVL
jgi:hypothetical protein